MEICATITSNQIAYKRQHAGTAYHSPTCLGNYVKKERNTMQENHTPNPPQEQDTYVSKCSKELQSALREIADLEQWLAEAKAALPQKVIQQLMAAPTRDEADALTWEVYWRLQGIPTTPLSDFYRMHLSQVRMIIGGASAEVFCKSCGKKERRNFNSRTAYKDSRDGIECDECREKKSQQNEQMMLKFRQERLEREAEKKALLEALKTMPYREYLETEHWKQLRMEMLKKAKFMCQLCAAKGQLHVHHKTYENRGNEPYSDLIVLCANCHGKFHDKLGAQS